MPDRISALTFTLDPAPGNIVFPFRHRQTAQTPHPRQLAEAAS